MLGMMMHQPLLISSLIEHAARFHGDGEIVSREADRSLFRYDYRRAEIRARKVAQTLTRLGIAAGDRVATLAWNNHRHFELYYGISGMGAVIHTINPRLVPDQIAYMLNHAEDQVLCFDVTFLPLVQGLLGRLTSVKHLILLADTADEASSLPNCLAYEELIGGETGDYQWPSFDELQASSLCYTSGTVGNPKGVLFSHRSTVLHAKAIIGPDCFGLAAADCICPVVPMFHVNGWGTPYASALTGAKLVLPGQYLDGESLCSLWRQEQVTITLGVPTVWQGALRHLETEGGDFGSLNRVAIGGSAVPRAMIEKFEEGYGVKVVHAWGMTETSPLGTAATLKGKHKGVDRETQLRLKSSQGRPIFLVDLKLVDAEGRRQPHDGVTIGDLYVRGPWVANGYFGDTEASAAAIDDEGWFRTGDVGCIDEDGYLRIVDRSKDLIKSGGEWISSIDLENAALAHPDIAYAAVIGVSHPKWEERPILLVVVKPDRRLDREDLRTVLAGKVAKWWLPDDIIELEQIPFGPTGKILKNKLREQFKDYRLPQL